MRRLQNSSIAGPGMVRSRRVMKKSVPKKLAREELTQYALRLLAGRALSASEVHTKLERRAAEPADVEPVMERLREYQVLDDARFAEGFAGARKDSGSFGRQRVLRDLRQRRVGATLAEKTVTEAFAGTDEAELVKAWLKRKLRNVVLADYLQDPAKLASVYRKLRYAGFSSSVAIRVLRQYSSRADEIEEGEETEGL